MSRDIFSNFKFKKMKKFIFTIIAVLFITVSVNAAKTVNPITSDSKYFVKKDVNQNVTYSVSYNIKETAEW